MNNKNEKNDTYHILYDKKKHCFNKFPYSTP